MHLIDELRSEHELIDQLLGSFRTFVDMRVRGVAQARDGARFLSFFRLYAGDFHHAREERILFDALAKRLELPSDRGPISSLTADHRNLAALIDEIEPLLVGGLDQDQERRRLESMSIQYSRGLWRHIDAENSVLFPESEARLRKAGVSELPSRAMTDIEREACCGGRELLELYPPAPDLDLIRGDGCAMCPAFVESCAGLEREWWNDWEWEEFMDGAE